MRCFSLIFVVCASGFAQTVSCDGVTYYGIGTASCTTADSNAFAQVMDGSVSASAWAAAGPGSATASASFSENYVLTVTGGSGEAFAWPELPLPGSGFNGAQAFASAEETIEGASGGCSASATPGGFGESNCNSTSLPFVFGVPQIVNVSMAATAQFGPNWSGQDDYPVYSGAGGGIEFAFYGANGQQINASYSFVPGSSVPEPRTFWLLAAMALAAVFARGAPKAH
jgi:hypothetical protein